MKLLLPLVLTALVGCNYAEPADKETAFLSNLTDAQKSLLQCIAVLTVKSVNEPLPTMATNYKFRAQYEFESFANRYPDEPVETLVSKVVDTIPTPIDIHDEWQQRSNDCLDDQNDREEFMEAYEIWSMAG